MLSTPETVGPAWQWGAIAVALVGALVLLGKGSSYGTRVAQRPDGSTPDGCPSGHAAVALAIASVALLWEMPLVWVVAAWGVALGVAWQRVSSRVHTVSQVLVGMGLGIVMPLALALSLVGV